MSAVTHLSTAATLAAVAIMVAYAFALLIFDQCLSTRASLETLIQYLQRMQDSWGFRRNEEDPDWCNREHEVNQRVKQALRDVGVIDLDPPTGRRPFRPLRISAPRVLAGWRQAHAIERLVWRNAPETSVFTRLQIAGGQLKAIDDPASSAVLLDVNRVLHRGTESARKLSRFSRIRRSHSQAGQVGYSSEATAVLREALFLIHDDRDTLFESLADQQRKAVWLAILGLGLMALAGASLHRESLLLLGAFGGFLSRLGRLLTRKALFTDYGSSAASLILAPVSGALSGWIGLILLGFLADIEVVTARYGSLWDHPLALDALALAFVFGFSERLFARVVTSVEGGTVHK